MDWNTREKVSSRQVGEKGEIIYTLVPEFKSGQICSNARELNPKMRKINIVMENIRDVRNEFSPTSWLFKINMQFSWTLRINKRHRKFCRSHFQDELSGRLVFETGLIVG